MKRIGIVAVAAALALAAFGAAAASAGTHGKHKKHPKAKATLVASVSDPFEISLTQRGKKVAHLKPGRYTIVVRDTASDHNFHLTGPGLNKLTSVSGKGTTTWKVRLKKGTYKFVCDPHRSFMKGSFTVK